jgi:hypothetical protein
MFWKSYEWVKIGCIQEPGVTHRRIRYNCFVFSIVENRTTTFFRNLEFLWSEGSDASESSQQGRINWDSRILTESK